MKKSNKNQMVLNKTSQWFVMKMRKYIFDASQVKLCFDWVLVRFSYESILNLQLSVAWEWEFGAEIFNFFTQSSNFAGELLGVAGGLEVNQFWSRWSGNFLR